MLLNTSLSDCNQKVVELNFEYLYISFFNLKISAMMLLSEIQLIEYGFVENSTKIIPNSIKIMSRDNVDLVIREDGIYYNNMGFDYPLNDSTALKKIYKELKSEDLKL